MPGARKIPAPPPGSLGSLTADPTQPGGLAWEGGAGIVSPIIKHSGNGATDMVVNATNVVTSVQSAPNWNNGMVLVIRSGNAAGATYIGTIVSGGGSPSVTVTPTPTGSGSGLTGFFGDDDTVGWQNALNQALPGQTVDFGASFISLIRQRNDTGCTTQNTSNIVLDPAITAADSGKWVTGPGIPFLTFVGVVVPGISFTLVNQSGTRVNATATATVTLCIGGLAVPFAVRLFVDGRGPFDPSSNPVRNLFGPTLAMVQAPGLTPTGLTYPNPMIGMDRGSKLGDFIGYSINQLDPSSATPTAFAPVVGVGAASLLGIGSAAGCRVDKPMFPNCYIGIDIQGGRHIIDAPQIGPLFRGYTIDHCKDFVDIRIAHCTPYWRTAEAQTYGPTAGTFDAFALTSAIMVEVARADGFHIERLQTFGTTGGLLCDDSTDATQNPTCPYGEVGFADLDNVSVGIQVNATQTNTAVLVAELLLGANGTGVGTAGNIGVSSPAGGSIAPHTVISAWATRGTFSGGKSLAVAGSIIVPGTDPGGPGGATVVPTVFQVGDGSTSLTFTTASFSDVGAQFNKTIAATVGDILRLDFDCTWNANGGAGADQVGFTFNIGGTDRGGALGLASPIIDVANNNFSTHIHFTYAVQAGDISGGTVAVKPRALVQGSVTLTIVNSANIVPMFSCMNLKH